MPFTRTRRTRTVRTASGFMADYNRDSVERALTHHVGEGGETGWTTDGKAGYKVFTGRGIMHLRTLREAYVYVVAMADKENRMQRQFLADMEGAS